MGTTSGQLVNFMPLSVLSRPGKAPNQYDGSGRAMQRNKASTGLFLPSRRSTRSLTFPTILIQWPGRRGSGGSASLSVGGLLAGCQSCLVQEASNSSYTEAESHNRGKSLVVSATNHIIPTALEGCQMFEFGFATRDPCWRISTLLHFRKGPELGTEPILESPYPTTSCSEAHIGVSLRPANAEKRYNPEVYRSEIVDVCLS
jgi:hypothetical protein